VLAASRGDGPRSQHLPPRSPSVVPVLQPMAIQPSLTRRTLMWSPVFLHCGVLTLHGIDAAAAQATVAAAADMASTTSQASQSTFSVSPGEDIAAALHRCPDGSVLEVPGGTYHERLVLNRAITLRAAQGAAVELVWETRGHYESTVECSGDGTVVLEGFTIRHSSPSVANNYAVHLKVQRDKEYCDACMGRSKADCTTLRNPAQPCATPRSSAVQMRPMPMAGCAHHCLQGCTAVLRRCDICSATGSGVGVEGGSPQLLDCTMHDCVRHGVAVFGDLEDSESHPLMERCTVSGNMLNGVLVRDGAELIMTNCVLSGNKRAGMQIIDAGGRYVGNTLTGNGGGAVLYDALAAEQVDPQQLCLDNRCSRLPTLVNR
jgi:hypothetical protein